MAISMTISTLNSYPSLKPSIIPFKTHPFHNPIPQFTLPSPITITTQTFNSRLTHAFPSKKFGYPFNTRNNNLGSCLNSQYGQAQGESGETEAEIRDFSQSTLPENFKYNPSSLPPWWSYVLALTLWYTRKIILWELVNWTKLASTIISFLDKGLKIVLAPVAGQLVFLIKRIETTLNTARVFYNGKMAAAPIKNLRLIILLTSIILAIAETSVPDSTNSQPYIMTFAGLVGYASVKGFIPEPYFWAILVGLFGFSRFIKKKDYVSSTLPVAAVLVAVGEPWVRVIVMASFLALAITHHWKNPSEEKEPDVMSVGNRVPFPLVCAGLAVALPVVVKWARYRHLTWIIV